MSASVAHAAVLALRNFLDDITLWGWADRPARQLAFAADVPRLPRPLPRALPPDDTALLAVIDGLDDPFALRAARAAPRRAAPGCAARVRPRRRRRLRAGRHLAAGPPGQAAGRTSVPLDETTIAALDTWAATRRQQRATPHPQTGRPTDFLFTAQGRRLGPWRIRSGLDRAAAGAGLLVHPGHPARITPHRLRHTYATSLANAGMSLQALMALLGHVTPEMTLRYAKLASPTLRATYDHAMTKARRRLPVIATGRPAVPNRVAWLASEFLKTRVAHGYCSRHLAAEARPYANICEQCDSFIPAPEHADVLAAQLTDIRALHTDAQTRGWNHEIHRHDRVAAKLAQA